MRTLALVSMVVGSGLVGCGLAGPETAPAPEFDSVHDRLAHEPTRLFIPGAGSSGALVAQRYTHDGWVSGTSPITIANGELVAKVAGDQLIAETFDVALDPIDVPETVFGKPAQLTGVRVTMTGTPTAAITWAGDDDATATLPLKLDLQWSIEIDNAVTQLGVQHLPEIALDVTLTGAGDHVDTTLGIHAMGKLWSWADLMELSQLDLTLTGATVD